MMAVQYFSMDSFWVDKSKYDDAERQYYERLGHVTLTPLAHELAKARQRLIEIRGRAEDGIVGVKDVKMPVQNEPVKKSCKDEVSSTDKKSASQSEPCSDMGAIKFLEKKMMEFQNVATSLQDQLNAINSRLAAIESKIACGLDQPRIAICPARVPAPKPVPAKKPAADDDDEDVDLFGSGSDDDDEAAAKLKEERLAAYNAKKSKKPALIAKSSILLDVKPWDDETDMKAMEAAVRKIEMDGLLWGASKQVPLAYGIHKLQINCVVEDEKVSIDLLQEQIEANEDFVQSVDIAAFNKI